MNSNNFNIFLIKSKLLGKIDIIYINAKNNNNFYIQNLKDYISFYIDDNKCNIINNNLLNNFLHNSNLWDYNDTNIHKTITDDMSYFIYNYDTTDKYMYDFLVQLELLII